MSLFYCHKCNDYRDSRDDGFHETEDGDVCDECEEEE